MNEANLIRFACPHCQKRVKVSAGVAGKRFACPNPSCRQPIDVPKAEKATESNARSGQFEVFISYSNKDQKRADTACTALESHQIHCWIAPRDIIPGREWGAAIIDGIDACRVMVLVFSAHANESPQVRREVERAINKGLAIVPLRVEDVKPSGAMEYALSNTHWLDAFKPPVDERMPRLVEAVKALLAPGSGPPPPVAQAATRSKSRRILRAILLAGSGFACLVCAGLGFYGYNQIASKEAPKDAGNKDKPKTPAESGEFFENFRKGSGIPDGWKGDAFRIVPQDDRNYLEVSRAEGQHFVTLPALNLSGDFYIEGEFLMLTHPGLVEPKLAVRLENKKSKSPPYELTISGRGHVWLGELKHNAWPTFKMNVPSIFRLTRKGETASVTVATQGVVNDVKMPAINYDTVSIGMDAAHPGNFTYSRLFYVKVAPLSP